jgi:hypothetical protein
MTVTVRFRDDRVEGVKRTLFRFYSVRESAAA